MADIKSTQFTGATASFGQARATDFTGLTFQQVVDLTPSVAAPKVVREGYKVPTPALDPSKLGFLIDDLHLTTPKDEPRVVSQSVAPGTLLTRGATVDLTLVPANVIKFNVFEVPHKQLIGKSITNVTEGILQDSDIRQTLLKYDTAAEVSAADKAKLTNAFKTQVNIDVNEANADTGFDAAFNSVRGALAFR